jgi:hypothetical protein
VEFQKTHLVQSDKARNFHRWVVPLRLWSRHDHPLSQAAKIRPEKKICHVNLRVLVLPSDSSYMVINANPTSWQQMLRRYDLSIDQKLTAWNRSLWNNDSILHIDGTDHWGSTIYHCFDGPKRTDRRYPDGLLSRPSGHTLRKSGDKPYFCLC